MHQQLPEIGPWVRGFFSGLDDAGVIWAVLRGADGLPDHTRYDIDLLLEPDGIDAAELVLAEAAEAAGWMMVRIIEKYRYRCCLMISPGPERRFVPVDLFGECLHRFYPMVETSIGLRERIRNEAGVWVTPPGFGAVVALVKELTRHPVFKENSREEMRDCARRDPESFRRAGDPVLGPDLCERLLKACQADDWPAVEALVPELRRAVAAGRGRFSPQAVRFFLGTLAHHFRAPMHAFVVLLGPDGSGKSTIADQVAERLYHAPFKVCPRFEYQFRLVPELKRVKHGVARLLGRSVPEAPAVEPGTRGSGMNRDHPPLVGMLYVTYYALDFLLGRLLLRKIRGQGGVAVFARYFHDYFYQLGYRRVPRGYLRLLERLAPRPDLILYLERDAQEIFDMKPELDVAEIRRQQQAIRELVAERPNAHVVDASGGIDATVADVAARVQAVFLDRVGVRK